MSTAVTNPALIPGIGSVKPAAPAAAPGRTSASPPSSGPAFAEILKQAGSAQPLHFSRHALERVQRRGIELDPTTLARLNEGVGRAAGKGSRDSVVLVDGTAFVVSVANRTVLTAVDQQHMREHVFTNIDSAVLA